MNKNKILIVLILLLSIILSGCQSATIKETAVPKELISEDTEPVCCSNPATIYRDNDLLVVTTWLKFKLDGQVTILDARDEKSYNAEHIKGAIRVTWQQFTDMEGKKPGDEGFGMLLSIDKLSSEISRLGIDNSKPVLVYGDSPKGWGEDGRIAWTLKSAGVKDVKLLNGGFSSWKDGGYPTDNQVPTITPTNYKVEKIDSSLNVTKDYIKENKNKLKIIDARESDEYNGAMKFGEKRGGHIENSINIPWTQVFYENGSIKDQIDLDKLFSDAGISKEDEIIVYCTKGIRSAHMALILRIAGYGKAKNYDGSFYEWAGDKNMILVK